MKYFITGITGSLGQEVCKILLEKEGNFITGFSRDEDKQCKLTKHPRLTLYLGDIRDRDRLLEASRNSDVIFHFAALKHIDLLEENPEESIETNIWGTQNVLHAQRINDIKRVVLSSTDKAAYPINVYGACKSIAEKLVLRRSDNFVSRYGNVIASRGSVIPQFVKTLKEENKVYITDTNMSRFWITLPEAAQFISALGTVSGKGGIKIPSMKGAKVIDVASVVAECMGINSYQTKEIGIRPGEKIHECLRMGHEGEEVHSNTAHQFERHQLKDLLHPIVRGLM